MTRQKKIQPLLKVIAKRAPKKKCTCVSAFDAAQALLLECSGSVTLETLATDFERRFEGVQALEARP